MTVLRKLLLQGRNRDEDQRFDCAGDGRIEAYRARIGTRAREERVQRRGSLLQQPDRGNRNPRPRTVVLASIAKHSRLISQVPTSASTCGARLSTDSVPHRTSSSTTRRRSDARRSANPLVDDFDRTMAVNVRAPMILAQLDSERSGSRRKVRQDPQHQRSTQCVQIQVCLRRFESSSQRSDEDRWLRALLRTYR